MVYDALLNNKTSKPRAFYVLYIRPNGGVTGHSVFKLSAKKMIITPRCKPIPMPDNVIKVVNQMRKDDGSPDGMVFCNILKEWTIDYIYGNVNSQDNSSCVSNKSWDIAKDGSQEDQKNIIYDYTVDDDEINNLNEDGLHLRYGLEDNINGDNNKYNYIKQGGVINQQDRQGNLLVVPTISHKYKTSISDKRMNLTKIMLSTMTTMIITIMTTMTTMTKAKIRAG